MHKEFEFVNDHKTPGLRTWFGLLDLRIRACQFVKQTKHISGSCEFTIYHERSRVDAKPNPDLLVKGGEGIQCEA